MVQFVDPLVLHDLSVQVTRAHIIKFLHGKLFALSVLRLSLDK